MISISGRHPNLARICTIKLEGIYPPSPLHSYGRQSGPVSTLPELRWGWGTRISGVPAHRQDWLSPESSVSEKGFPTVRGGGGCSSLARILQLFKHIFIERESQNSYIIRVPHDRKTVNALKCTWTCGALCCCFPQPQTLPSSAC